MDYFDAIRSEDQQHRRSVCNGKGLVADLFPTGAAQSTMHNAIEMIRAYLMMDLGRVPGEVRDFVLNQFEKGVGHLIFETSIKLVMWQQ